MYGWILVHMYHVPESTSCWPSWRMNRIGNIAHSLPWTIIKLLDNCSLWCCWPIRRTHIHIHSHIHTNSWHIQFHSIIYSQTCYELPIDKNSFILFKLLAQSNKMKSHFSNAIGGIYFFGWVLTMVFLGKLFSEI